MKRPTFEIVTRSPIEKEKNHFNLLIIQSYQVLKYRLVYHQFLYQVDHRQRKLTTSLLELIFLFQSLSMQCVVDIHIRSLQISVLIWIRLVISIFWALVSNLSWIVTSFKIYSYVTYICYTFIFFLCPGKIKLTERKKVHMKTYFHCNNDDTFLDIFNTLREYWLDFKNFNLARQAKRLLDFMW